MSTTDRATPPRWPPGRKGFLFVAAASFLYCVWLGAHWLRLSYSSGEIPLYASRIWDFRYELARGGRVPWWSATFMNGSSKALSYAGDFATVPWALLQPAFGYVAAGKIVALVAIGAAGMTMFACARYVLRSDAAAAVAALVLLFHPLLLVRAAGTEHISVVVFVALLPLGWLFFARLLDAGRTRDLVACSVTLVLMLWAQNKQTVVMGLFFAAFAAWSIVRAPERRGEKLRALAMLAALSAPLSAFIAVPVLSETKVLKLLAADPLEAWQRMYAVSSLGAVVHRAAGEVNYGGIVIPALAGLAVLFGRNRRQRGLFWLIVGFEAAAVALAHGPRSVGVAAVRALTERSPASSHVMAALLLTLCAAFLVELARRKLTTGRRRLAAIVALTAFLVVPWFRVISVVPLFRDVRAPEVFWQVPGAFFGALLAGFFVTDVAGSGRLARRGGIALALLVALLLLDAWPFERPMMESDVSPATLDRARAMYGALGEEAKREPGKVYVVSGQLFHLMGPSWGGPPLTTEAGLAFMGPRGTGLLAVAAGETLGLQRAYLDLVGVRWLVFDKSDPRSRTPMLEKQLEAYRKIYPLDTEDEDFAVFRVPHARPYVSGYRRSALAYGDAPNMPELALELARSGYALVHADGERPEEARPGGLASFDAVYLSSPASMTLSPEDGAKVTVLGPVLPPLPPKQPREEPIANLAVTRASSERVQARFTATAPCTAVVDESHYPYWHATLDGSPVRILRVAYGLMGVPVETGEHELALTYEPPRAYAWGALVSAGALIACLIAVALEARRLRTRPA